MRSIIDQVREVEDQAVTIRQEAVQQGKDLVASAQAQVKEQALKEAEAERLVLKDATQQAEASGKVQAEEIIAGRAAEADADCKRAEEKLPQAVTYLLEKVVNDA
ncbi:hypothetical protein LJC07_06670 [Christensenellaceae bacterium OttesenSCG-928-L17]|nr:hypothetical protein [Christensenellaceae bacterium OttesenSCG-928-L17]